MITIPLPAALAAFAVLFVVAAGIGACRVSARRFVGPWVIDRRAQPGPATVRVDHVERCADGLPQAGTRRTIEGRTLPTGDDALREEDRS